VHRGGRVTGRAVSRKSALVEKKRHPKSGDRSRGSSMGRPSPSELMALLRVALVPRKDKIVKQAPCEPRAPCLRLSWPSISVTKAHQCSDAPGGPKHLAQPADPPRRRIWCRAGTPGERWGERTVPDSALTLTTKNSAAACPEGCFHAAEQILPSLHQRAEGTPRHCSPRSRFT
jgi:hypothetical protein